VRMCDTNDHGAGMTATLPQGDQTSWSFRRLTIEMARDAAPARKGGHPRQ
jgi:hypothetical protein